LEEKQQIVYVIGHKNPDTDSICAAIAYAALKRKITGQDYREKRCGQVNPETQFVLDRFGVNAPSYISDVRTQVKDIEIRKVEGVSQKISLKKAWTILGENQIVTLPIVGKENHLKGLITIGDIAKAYMDVYDSEILSKAKTSFSNIVETLEGEMITGDISECLEEGKVLIAAANPDLMENYIEKGDIVILGNRYESQLCAIEMEAKCIIVCDGANVSRTITKLAEARGCTIISTPFDTYTVARMVNQSMPIEYFMSTEGITIFTEDDYLDDIREVMAKKRHRDFPIIDKHEKLVGMISRRNLLGARKKKLIMVDHNELGQAVEGIDEAEIMEVIDHHRIGNIETVNPVYFRNQPVGCTSTIIYQMYQENNIEITPEIAGILCSAILSDTLVYRSPTCTPLDKVAAENLARIAGIDVEEYAKEMFAAGSNLRDKSAEEIFYQDFKKFSAGEVTFGVGQITSMSTDELENIKQKLVPYMEKAASLHGVQMIFFMLTNILDESTELLFQGENVEEVLMQAFHSEEPGESLYLKDFVSRKKQLIPVIVGALQKE